MQEKKALSSRGRGRLRGFLELRRPWGPGRAAGGSGESGPQGECQIQQKWGWGGWLWEHSLPLGLALGSPIFSSGCEGTLGGALESLHRTNS